MRIFAAFAAALGLVGLAMSVPALAAQQSTTQAQQERAPVAEVLERDAQGRATRIRVDGFEYAVCGEGQTDGCINPREAGLDFGGVPIDYWPGRPASEIDGPLPVEPPAPAPAPVPAPGKP